MASGDTKTQQYLDVAANGTRADLPSDTCCETRTQTLIRGVAERIMDVEDEVERLENNPDVVDIVATYAALQAYPTSQLTDKDVVRVLQDETHDGDSTYYRWSTTTQTWTYIGESKQYTDFVGTDGTAGGQNGLVPAPVATDAGKFLNANGSWEEVQAGATYTAGDGINISAQDVISATNTGKAKVLTTADYNANSSNWSDTDPTHFNCVALWELAPGMYTKSSSDVVALYSKNTAHSMGNATIAIVGKQGSFGRPIILLSAGNTTQAGWTCGSVAYVQNGLLSAYKGYSLGAEVQDNLTSTYGGAPLSARQGKVLKDLIDSIATRGAGAPTTSTTGSVGTLYEDTTNGDLYICTDATNPYVWEAVGAGGSGPTVVQTTGTSTADVMSQNAVTSMIYQDPATKQRVQLGNNAYADTQAIAIGPLNSTTTGAIAIGYQTAATGRHSVAIGRSVTEIQDYSVAIGGGHGILNAGQGCVSLGFGSRATTTGEMNIGSTDTSYGYNSSNYRLLTGLYDPQNAHDAATKGYVDGLVGNVASALNTINNGTGA